MAENSNPAVSRQASWLNSVRRLARREPMLFIGAGMLLLLLMMALLPSIFAHQSPYTIDVSRALKPPSAANLFGTDDTGRDVYARVVHGTGVTLAICAGSLLLAALGKAITFRHCPGGTRPHPPEGGGGGSKVWGR